MLLRLLAAFIIIPLIELALLLKLAQWTSVWTTILVVVVTGIIGSVLARREGLMAWHRFRSALAEGRMPSEEIQDGLMIVFAAALLLTPGLLTDFVGFLLLTPYGRRRVRQAIVRRWTGSIQVQVYRSGSPFDQSPHAEPLHRTERNAPLTIDSEAVRKD